MKLTLRIPFLSLGNDTCHYVKRLSDCWVETHGKKHTDDIVEDLIASWSKSYTRLALVDKIVFAIIFSYWKFPPFFIQLNMKYGQNADKK